MLGFGTWRTVNRPNITLLFSHSWFEINISYLNCTTVHTGFTGAYYPIHPHPHAASLPSEQMWLTGPMIDEYHSPHRGSQVLVNLVDIATYGDKMEVDFHLHRNTCQRSKTGVLWLTEKTPHICPHEKNFHRFSSSFLQICDLPLPIYRTVSGHYRKYPSEILIQILSHLSQGNRHMKLLSTVSGLFTPPSMFLDAMP